MKHRILVTGANGQLGSEIQSLAPMFNDYQFMFCDIDELNLCDQNAIERFFDHNDFDMIVNCAAYTAVDQAESQQELAFAINHKSVEIIAGIARAKNISVVHISTDYVFDGQGYRPYIETDETAPQNIYGKSKLAGEKAIQEANLSNSLIIRTSWLYSSFGTNFVKTMLTLGKERDELTIIFDQIGTPTYAKNLAQIILSIIPKIKNDQVEIYHYSNEGVCSWYDFAKAIFEEANIPCQVKPIETKEYPTPAGRPHYSLLNKSKFKTDFNIEIPYWKDSLHQCLKQIRQMNNDQ